MHIFLKHTLDEVLHILVRNLKKINNHIFKLTLTTWHAR